MCSKYIIIYRWEGTFPFSNYRSCAVNKLLFIARIFLYNKYRIAEQQHLVKFSGISF